MIYENNSKTVAIVTSFIDIGRGDWKGWSNRSVEKYFEYFKNISHLDNPIYIYIEDRFKSRILDLRNGKPTYFIKSNVYYDFNSVYQEIKRVHKLDSFKKSIPDHLIDHPEYWSVEYVFVTLLKPYIVELAISQFEIKEDLVSWIDFGYKRDSPVVGKYLSLPFPKDRITAFSQKEILNPDINFSILNNDIYIIGSPIIGSVDTWKILISLCRNSINELFEKDMIDDDQTIWLMSYIKNANLFNVIVTEEWFSLFKYNTSHTFS
jgi:protein YibB